MNISSASRLIARALSGLLLAATLTGCAAQQGQQLGETPVTEARGFDGDVLITVENNDFRDATVYVYWSGVKRRVGRVTGKTKKTFRMDWLSEEAQFGADFLGRGSFRTETIFVDPGDHLNLFIPIR